MSFLLNRLGNHRSRLLAKCILAIAAALLASGKRGLWVMGSTSTALTPRFFRLSRSLLDFAKMMETFERHRMAFGSGRACAASGA